MGRHSNVLHDQVDHEGRPPYPITGSSARASAIFSLGYS